MKLTLTAEHAAILCVALDHYIGTVERVEIALNEREDSGPCQNTPASRARGQIEAINPALYDLIGVFMNVDSDELGCQLHEWLEFIA